MSRANLRRALRFIRLGERGDFQGAGLAGQHGTVFLERGSQICGSSQPMCAAIA
jgi:hypothetical protein